MQDIIYTIFKGVNKMFFGTLGTSILIAFLTSIFNTVGSAVARPLVDLAQSTGWLDPDTYSVMSQYCEDLTEYAKMGKLHDAIGRDKEINSMIDILTRNGKGNPCVVGDSGVGKTALVEGLAYRISQGNVPDDFKNKKIIKVNMVNLIAGKSYNNGNGAVGRMRALFDKAKEDKDVILFIDEFHQVVQCNAAELFKTYLDRGEIKVIAATTTSEYGYISKDPALERRFTRVFLEEPNKYETLEILKCLRKEIEKIDGVKISDESLLASVELTGQYMKSRSYPDKAIDVVNSAVKSVCRKNKLSSNPGALLVVSEEDIKSVVSSETNIPLGNISDLEFSLLNSMDERIKCNISGQDEAVKVVCDAVRRGRSGIRYFSRPRASFLFTGTSGVGKTALAEALGIEVGSLIKIDMSQYNSRNALSELIGSKINGYKGELTEKVWKKPYSVVLFDGIEKADSSVLNIILGIIENGNVVDSSGNKVDFTNTIVVMTTNVGEKLILNEDKNTENDGNTKNKVLSEINSVFGNELSNRVDDILVFNKLDKKDLKKIAEIFISSLESKLNAENISLKISEDVYEYISKIEINHKIGARQIRRIVCEKMEKEIAKLIIEKKVEKGSTIICNTGKDGIEFEVQK